MNAVEYETVNIPNTTKIRPLCENYAQRQAYKPVVIMSCEGACLRREVARRAANTLCFEMAAEKTARSTCGSQGADEAAHEFFVH